MEMLLSQGVVAFSGGLLSVHELHICGLCSAICFDYTGIAIFQEEQTFDFGEKITTIKLE